MSLAKKGMNKSTHPSQLDQQEYTFAMNANMESLGGDTYSITNEHSNILASKFNLGYKVVGFKNDVKLNKTFFFLTNEEAGVSEFGYILNTTNVESVEDTSIDCGDCITKNILSEPLEGQVQLPHQSYVTLLSDCLDNKCFNLSVNHPVKKIEIKNEKKNSIIVFTDNFNPPRYIQLNNLEIYSYTGEEVCSDESSVEKTCLACSKMKIFRDFEIPQIKPETITLGGRLRMGTYQFLIAYSDALGNEISEYYSITNTIRIFDQSNATLEQENLADRTNFSIRLSVNNLDKNYTHYKIAVIQIADINNATSYFEEGVHTINDNTIVYSGEENKNRIDYSKLIKQNIFVKKWEGLTQSNNYLFGYGIEVEKEVNLQPVVNFLGQFLKWQSSIALEDLYEDGVSASKFLGYNRDEVVAIGIRFYGKEGYRTAVHPLIGRLPTVRPDGDISTENKYDYDEVSILNKDYLSIQGNSQDCIESKRTKRWQVYNDATYTDRCTSDVNIETFEVEEESEKVCYVPKDLSLPPISSSVSKFFTVELTEPYTNLEDYIEDNKEFCQSNPKVFGESDLCYKLDVLNYPQECSGNLFGDNCENTVKLNSEIEIIQGSINGETFLGTEASFPDEYPKLKKPTQCTIYSVNNEGKFERDKTFEALYEIRRTANPVDNYSILTRDYNFSNESCQTADDIQNIENSTVSQGYFNNYVGATTVAGIQTNKKPALNSFTSIHWTNRIHKGALWFKGAVDKRESFIIQISDLKSIFDKDDNTRPGVNPTQEVRLSIFDKCNSESALFSDIIPIIQRGSQYKLKLTSTGFEIDKGDGSQVQIITADNLFSNGNFYISIDNPIWQTKGLTVYNELSDLQTKPIVTKYRTVPTDGCFSIATRDIKFNSAKISWDKIDFRKKSTYSATCVYDQPVIEKCEAIPYKFGNLAYHESEETYPDNKELYDSSKLLIKGGYFPNSIKQEFEKNFVKGVNQDGLYTLKSETDLTCKPIRHFKLPSNKVSPFMYESKQTPFSKSIIYPLGFTIDEEIINIFLDVAVDNGLITKDRRDSLTKYEIVRGDISNDRSIHSSGLLYDIRTYTEDKKEILYSNYPFNDLGVDKLNLDTPKTSISQNNKFTFHSPETDYYKSTLPGEMSVQGYMFGKSKGVIDEVKEHPKWTILSSKARKLAGYLAGLEVAAEVAVKAAQSAETWRFFGGVAGVSANPYGAVLNGLASGLSLASGIISGYGRYRYEWLKIFRDLGQPKNFAYYYYGEGNYNYLRTLQEEEQTLRSFTIAKKIKSNKSILIDETTGERLTVNNIDREESVFLSLGKFPIVYEDEYKKYDNNKIDFNSSSMTYQSESNSCTVGKSSDIIRNIASPYVALKNYIPSQYGTINSIKWLPTGYIGDLKKPKSSCVSIFGGDTFITRHTLKRKIPIFLTDSMGQAPMTPFNYSFYSNIGKKPKFYADYELNKDFEKESSLFPDLDSDYSFDCYKKQGNYVTPPSKFYLYYYGVPNFLCESRINTSYRYGKKELSTSFFPNVGDIGEWTQQVNVPIRTSNYFFYNDAYSRNGVGYSFRTLPDSYSKKLFDIAYDKPNGVMYSLPDNEENNLNEPWLIYRPYDFYEFPTSFGKIIDLKGIESSQVLGRFENQTAIFNSVDITVETGQKVENNDMGSGGIFARRPVTFSETDLGYVGSQTTQMVSSEYGHFFADAKRGYFFKINSGGKGVEELSSNSGGKPTGMSHWFKEQLPFKILKKIPNADVDNAINGVGITMGWDSMFKRVFLTKKDYIPKSDCIEFIEGVGYVFNKTKCDDIIQTPVCPTGYFYNTVTLTCEKTISYNSCPDGYTYNSLTSKCELSSSAKACPIGYSYDTVLNKCKKTTVVVVGEIPFITATPSNSSMISGNTTDIVLTSTVAGTTYSWTNISQNILGATEGSGNIISDTLIALESGTVTYSVVGTTPQGCTGTTIVTVSVRAVIESTLCFGISGADVCCNCSAPVVDCVLSDWVNGQCQPDGTLTRTRIVITPSSGTGLPCGILTEVVTCPVLGRCYSMTTNSNGYSEINVDSNIRVRFQEPGSIPTVIVLNTKTPISNIDGSYTYHFCSLIPMEFKNDDLTTTFNWGNFSTNNLACTNTDYCKPITEEI